MSVPGGTGALAHAGAHASRFRTGPARFAGATLERTRGQSRPSGGRTRFNPGEDLYV